MKKLLVILFCFTVSISSTFAGSEEENCLQILKENVKTQFDTDFDKFFQIDYPGHFEGMMNWVNPAPAYMDMNYANFNFLWKLSQLRYSWSPQTDWKLTHIKQPTGTGTISRISNIPYSSHSNDEADILISDPKAWMDPNAYKNKLIFFADGSIRYNRRNNIGTIILGHNYIETKFISFGLPTDFVFPYDTGMGESYVPVSKKFGDRNIYFHYLNDGTFVSCGYLHLRPDQKKGGVNQNDWGYTNRLGDLDAGNYYSNVIPEGRGSDGGFELLSKNEVRDGNRYAIGKVLISAIDADLNPLMSIDVLTVAYDNKSSYFNEYETFPLQVQSMTNADRYSTVNDLQKDFLGKVYNETCLMSVHPDKASLPAKCHGNYQSLSLATEGIVHSSIAYISDFLVPSAHARLEPEYVKTGSSLEPSEIYIDSNFTFALTKKLDSIPDPKFRDFFRIAVNPEIEQMFKSRQEKGILLSDYEKVFMSCGFTADERVRLLSEWLKNLDVSKFDLNNISYPDARLGDCILPYPDKTHLKSVIPNSFPSNQINAQIANGVTLSGIVIHEPDYLNGVNLASTERQNSPIKIIFGILFLIGGCATLYFTFFRKQ